MTTALFKKLNLGEHRAILVLQAPDSFDAELEQLADVKILRKAPAKPTAKFAIGFAVTQAELDRVSTELIRSTEGDAILWVAYPKGASKKYRCEFNRDQGWTVLGAAGFEPVRQVAVDDDWSALRFRRAEHIQSLTRRKSMAISPEGKRRATK